MKQRLPLLLLAMTLVIDMLGFGLILPLIPVYIRHYGGTPVVGGWLLACYSVMQFLCSPMWGRVSDRIGRRKVILVGLVGSALVFFYFGFAPNLVELFIARILCGVLTSASLPTCQAYIADVTPPDKRAAGMAVLGAAFGIGFAFGPVVAGVLSAHPAFGLTALQMPAAFAAVLALVNFVLAFAFLPEPAGERSHASTHSIRRLFPDIVSALRRPEIGAEITVFAYTTFAFAAVESSFSWLVLLRFNNLLNGAARHAWALLHPTVPFASLVAAQQTRLIERAQTEVTSHIFAVVGVTILLVQGAMMAGLAKRLGEFRLVRFGATLLSLTLLGIALAPSLWMIYVLSALVAVGAGVMNPSLSALITEACSAEDRGLISGAQQGVGSLARTIAPPINNWVMQFNTAVPFLVSTLLMGIATALSLRIRPPAAAPAEQAAAPLVH